jgi:hypothetical protein
LILLLLEAHLYLLLQACVRRQVAAVAVAVLLSLRLVDLQVQRHGPGHMPDNLLQWATTAC